METPTTPTADPLDAIRAAYRDTLGVWTGWTWPDAPAGDLVRSAATSRRRSCGSRPR